MVPKYLIGVDVGTGSARAGIFDRSGKLLATAKRSIDLYRDDRGFVEQSSQQIWEAVCECVRASVSIAGIDPGEVAGIGFDATCSLVVVGAAKEKLPVSSESQRDVIVWMDHRALDQAERINAGGHDVLKYVGGRISPEMQTPKLLWLRENNPETYAKAQHFFDLTDFLTFKATGSLERSSCTVTCKWTYLAHERRWDADYFRAIGLDDLADDDFKRIGQTIVAPGTPLGQGLSAQAASEMGLVGGIAIAAGLIDAHAGGVGTVGARDGVTDPVKCLAYVFGTSSCTMTTTVEPAFVPGVWGPYYSAMMPGKWLNEGGQSAAGAAIDHLVRCHPAALEAGILAKAEGKSLTQWLGDKALTLANSPSDAVRLVDTLHVVPEFLGNRAPFADPYARAVIVGQGMETGVDSLVALYIAGLCGLGYGLRQIIDTQCKNGAPVEVISVSGGAGSHPLIRQLLADASGLPVEVIDCEEPVLLGSAILGAMAAGLFAEMETAMSAMSRVGTQCLPHGDIRTVHEARYRAFLKLQESARDIRQSMTQALQA